MCRCGSGSAAYAIARHFSRSHWAGFVATLLLVATWLNSLSVGYGLFFWVHHPAIGIMSGAWTIAVWALWINLDEHPQLWPLPYLLAATLIYLHPTNALILGGCFGFATLISARPLGRTGARSYARRAAS